MLRYFLPFPKTEGAADHTPAKLCSGETISGTLQNFNAYAMKGSNVGHFISEPNVHWQNSGLCSYAVADPEFLKGGWLT